MTKRRRGEPMTLRNAVVLAVVLSFGCGGNGGGGGNGGNGGGLEDYGPTGPSTTPTTPSTTRVYAGEWYGDAYMWLHGETLSHRDGFRFAVEVPREPRHGESMSLTWRSTGNEPAGSQSVRKTGTWDCEFAGTCLWSGAGGGDGYSVSGFPVDSTDYILFLREDGQSDFTYYGYRNGETRLEYHADDLRRR